MYQQIISLLSAATHLVKSILYLMLDSSEDWITLNVGGRHFTTTRYGAGNIGITSRLFKNKVNF